MPRNTIHMPNSADSLPACVLVVGSTLLAERIDRPAAAVLAPRLARMWGMSNLGDVQCITDFLYLEEPLLFALPAICLGSAARNAATAHLLGRIDKVRSDPRGFSIFVNVLDTPPRAQLVAADADAMLACCDSFEARFAAGFIAPRTKRRAA